MAGCNSCSGHCIGCHNIVELTDVELAILNLLGQYAFLPVGRKPESEMPIWVFDSEYNNEAACQALQCLEKKGLIILDYDIPLKGFEDSTYLACPIRGSIGMTAKGQQVLVLLDIQGTE